MKKIFLHHPKKMKTVAEEKCGCNLTPLFKKWVYP